MSQTVLSGRKSLRVWTDCHGEVVKSSSLVLLASWFCESMSCVSRSPSGMVPIIAATSVSICHSRFAAHCGAPSIIVVSIRSQHCLHTVRVSPPPLRFSLNHLKAVHVTSCLVWHQVRLCLSVLHHSSRICRLLWLLLSLCIKSFLASFHISS